MTKKYDGLDKRRTNRGRPSVIEEGSNDECLIADWMEDNMGFRRTTQFLNEHRTEEGRMPVDRSAVMAAFDRMEPKLDRVQKEVQGGASEAWANARRNQMKQLLIMRGVITKDELQQEYKDTLPDHFNPDLLPKLSRHQVVFFDEMHMNQEGGPVYNQSYQIRFPRDEQGRYSPRSATNPNPIYNPIRKKPSYKYTQQARFCLGCAAILRPDGSVCGKRSKVFDYTGQRLVSIRECKRRIAQRCT